MEIREKWTIVRDYLKSYYSDTLLFIFLISISISAISSMLFTISTGGILSNIFLSNLFFVDNGTFNLESFNPAILNYLMPTIIIMFIMLLFVSIVKEVINQSLNVELRYAINDNRAMKFNSIIKVIKDNFVKFTIITLQLVLINFIVVLALTLIALLVLLLGAIIVPNESFFIFLMCLISLVYLIIIIGINTRLTYSYITVNDNPTLSPFEAIKLAYRASKNHALAIFSISLKYVLIAITPSVIFILLLAITLDTIVSVPLLVVILIFQMIFPLLLMPHYLSYKIVYYDRELKVKDLL